MSNVAVLRSERADLTRAREYLGPAEVTAADPTGVEVQLPNGDRVRARPALAFAYEAQPADLVLVIGNADGYYVIGVLRATGKAVLSFPGDLEVRASGVLDLTGDQGVRIRAPVVEVEAGKLRQIAGSVLQKFASLRQHVTDLMSVRAGQAHTVVDGASVSQSKSATILTQEKVTINGKAIHLG